MSDPRALQRPAASTVTAGAGFPVSTVYFLRTRGGGCHPGLHTWKQVQGQSQTHMMSLKTSRSQQVSGPRRSGCREGRSPYNCCSRTTNCGLVMKLNASTWLAGQRGPTPLLPGPCFPNKCCSGTPTGAHPSPQRRDLSGTATGSPRPLLSVAGISSLCHGGNSG